MKTWVFITVLLASYMHGPVFGDGEEDDFIEDGNEQLETPTGNTEINNDEMDYTIDEDEDMEDFLVREPRASSRRRRLYGGGGGKSSRRRGWWKK